MSENARPTNRATNWTGTKEAPTVYGYGFNVKLRYTDSETLWRQLKKYHGDQFDDNQLTIVSELLSDAFEAGTKKVKTEETLDLLRNKGLNHG